MKKKVGILTTLSLIVSKIVYSKPISMQTEYGVKLDMPALYAPGTPTIFIEETPTILDILLKIGKIAIVPIIILIGIVAIVKIKKKKK